MKGEYKIDFSIYSKEKIEEGIGIFQDYGKIKLLGDYLIISGETYEDIEILFHEMMNYIIALEC